MPSETKIILPQPFEEAAQKTDFIAIPIKKLRIETIMGLDFYIKVGPESYVKYSETVPGFDENVFERLKDSRHKFLYFNSKDIDTLNSHFDKNLECTLSDKSATVREKTTVIYNTTTHVVKELLANPQSPKQIKRSRRVVEATAQMIISGEEVLDPLLQLSSVDYYTYSHSVEVMMLSILLGQRLGFNLDSRLVDLGQAALLHDVGKSFINPEITQKPGPLDEVEFAEMKRHPDFGYQALKSTEELTKYTLRIVRHHHEKLNGNGYPHHLNSNEIGLEIRIVTCADIYNALTTRRVYRKNFRPYHALKILKDMTNSEIDEKVFRELVHLLGKLGDQAGA